MYMQMELEAENWWLQSIGYDFDGKKTFMKKYHSCRKFGCRKNPIFKKKIFQILYCNSYVTRLESRVALHMNYNREYEFAPNFENAENFEWIDLQDEIIFLPRVFSMLKIHTSTYWKN